MIEQTDRSCTQGPPFGAQDGFAQGATAHDGLQPCITALPPSDSHPRPRAVVPEREGLSDKSRTALFVFVPLFGSFDRRSILEGRGRPSRYTEKKGEPPLRTAPPHHQKLTLEIIPSAEPPKDNGADNIDPRLPVLPLSSEDPRPRYRVTPRFCPYPPKAVRICFFTEQPAPRGDLLHPA